MIYLILLLLLRNPIATVCGATANINDERGEIVTQGKSALLWPFVFL